MPVQGQLRRRPVRRVQDVSIEPFDLVQLGIHPSVDVGFTIKGECPAMESFSFESSTESFTYAMLSTTVTHGDSKGSLMVTTVSTRRVSQPARFKEVSYWFLSSNVQGSRRENDATVSLSALYLVPIATRFHVSLVCIPQLGADVVTLAHSVVPCRE
eukprot:PhM_4_TR15713/c2_g3_i1/m.28666